MLRPGEVMKTLHGFRYGAQDNCDIITVCVYPPIPTRDWDWCCYKDGDEQKPWTYGWGVTEKDALADFRRLRQEAFEAINQPTGDYDDSRAPRRAG